MASRFQDPEVRELQLDPELMEDKRVFLRRQYGYGAYGYTIEPTFDSTIVSLLDRGLVYAIAHVCGGQDRRGSKKHVLGTDPRSDPVICEEKDTSFYLSVGKTRRDLVGTYLSGRLAPPPNRLVYLHGLLTVSAGEWAKFTDRSVFEDLYFDWQVKDE